MRLCNILVDGAIHLALYDEAGVVDLTAMDFPYAMEDVLEGKGRQDLERVQNAERTPLSQIQLANLISRPGKILCVGLNYPLHAANVNMDVASEPVLFSKFADALAPSGASIELPHWERSYDYEAELVVVIGKRAWNVSEDRALEHVFGYTCGNDLSCRAAQVRSGQWLIGKTMPGFAPCGPCIVTADAFDPGASHALQCTVNGELRQSAHTTDMLFNCARIISYASRYVRLDPGDLIFTGTPSGVACERPKAERTWLKPGDVVEVTIDGIGTLRNPLR